MTSLAIGPRNDSPSWSWVGQSLADFLAGEFDVRIFDTVTALPDADLILVVKQRPPASFIEAALERAATCFFAPVDVYQDPAEIAADAIFLKHCRTVFLHAETLRPFLQPFAGRILSVEHQGRYTLGAPAAYRETGFLLWIGAIQHLPYQLAWLERHPPKWPVRLLTDIGSAPGRLQAHILARSLGVHFVMAPGAINGFETEAWSEAVQSQWMRACKAAFDIKGSSFNQTTKPPTKAQKFLASGIPFGCDPAHPARHYFAPRGFEIVDAADARLYSEDYWRQVREISGPLRRETTMERVGAQFRAGLLSGLAA